MSLFQPTKDDLDEIVFENRNKLYGAYELRKSYDDNLLKASASSFLVLGIFVSSVYVFSLLRKDPEPIIPVIAPVASSATTVSRIEIILDDLSTALSLKSDNNLHYRIVRDDQANTIRDHGNPEIPLSPEGKEQGTGKTDGREGGTGGQPGGEGGKPGGSDPMIPEPQVTVMFAEIMPAFPGGQDKLRDYLTRNLRYPEEAMRMGVEGKVMISFVVNPQGDVTDIRVERSLGFGCDDEAIRVVSAMPKWSAGIQNGKRLPVKMILPIQFRLQ